MSLGSPYNVGSTASASAVSTTVVTAGTDANSDATTIPSAGDSVFVLIGIASGTVGVTSVTDTHSNTYTLSGKNTPSNTQSCFVYECLNPGTHLSSGNTVTVTWTATTASTTNVRVIGCAGVASSSADDQSGVANGSGTAVSVAAAGALAQASELAVVLVQTGSATGGVVSFGTFAQMGHNLRSGTGSYLGVATLDTTATTAPSASATLTTTGSWGALLLTFKAATGGVGSLTVTTSSPLPGGQVAVAYTDQLAASGGVPPYTWSVSSGSFQTGLTLTSGSGGGGGSGGGAVGYVGLNAGPQGAPTVAQLSTTAAAIGPVGYTKFFYSSGGTGPIYTGLLGGDANGGSGSGWSAAGGSAGYTPAAITAAIPGIFIIVSWGVLMSAAAINSFVASIPHSVAEVGFSFQSEPEGAYAASAGSTFVSDWTDQANKVRAAQASTPVKLTLITSQLEQPYQVGGTANQAILNGSFIPPASVVDVYGIDFYDRVGYWAGNDMSTNNAWINWTKLVKGLGKPLALTEYGISGSMTAAQQNSRLQADWNYIQSAFGSGGSLSPYPLYAWLYWNTDGTALTSGTSWGQMLSTTMQQQWSAIEATAGGSQSGGGGTGTGGVLSGTPTVASTATPTVEVTDSVGTTATKVLSLTISSAATLAVATSSLPGGTENVPYNAALQASGGTPPYTWSQASGTPPTGLSLASSGVISGTPTVVGTTSASYEVTDAASATASAALSITVSSALTISTATLPGGTVGTAYSQVVAAVDGVSPYLFGLASGTLPPGLTIDPDGSLTSVAGTIFGTPTVSGAYQFTVIVTDTAGATDTQLYNVAIASQVSLSIGRRLFGSGLAAFGYTVGPGGVISVNSGGTWTFWTTKQGSTGSQYTDLLTYPGGSPVTSVTLDSTGFPPQFQAPSGITSMYADANGGAGPRHLIICDDLDQLVVLLLNSTIGGG